MLFYILSLSLYFHEYEPTLKFIDLFILYYQIIKKIKSHFYYLGD